MYVSVWLSCVLLQSYMATVCICMRVILIFALSLLLSSVRRVCFVLTYGAVAVYLHFNSTHRLLGMCVGEDIPEPADPCPTVISVYLLLFTASVRR